VDVLQKILDFLQANQILLTALGIGGAGTIILWLKGVPQVIYNFLKKEFTTEMTITSYNTSFFDVLKFIGITYKDKNFRKLKLIGSRWGWKTGKDDRSILTMGYGTHIIRYKGNFLLVTLTKETANQTVDDKDTLTFSKLGRDHKIFDIIIKDAETLNNDTNVNKIYKMEQSWSYIKDQKKRSIESIFLEKDKKNLLIKTLDEFLGKEEWYLSHGIPYQLGILLYGPPGTGKTSLIKAIASYLDYAIYYLPVDKLSSIEDASSSLPDKCIMVIEDIDSNPYVKGNSGQNPISGNVPSENIGSILLDTMHGLGLSEILNSMDGLFSSHGRILIATTNHIEKLDAALIRPGRIDLKLDINYINKEILKEFLDSFFPNNYIKDEDIEINRKATVAELQNLVLQNKIVKDILEYCKQSL
jgi:mitochondrial chaperone BCS1